MANATVERLKERRLSVWEQAKTLADRAAEENRAFSAEEQGSWESMNAELDALDSRMKSILEGEKRAKDTEDKLAEIDGRPIEKGKQPESKTATELRAFLRGEQGAPRYYDVRADGPVNFRDLSKLTNAAGLFTVPTSFYNRLVAHMIEVSAMLQAGATILNTSSGENIQVPKTLTHGTGALVAETAAIPEADGTFGQITLGAFKYGQMIQVSRELVDDTGVDLEGYLAMAAGRAIGNAFGTHLVTGDGTAKPRGIVTDATVGVTGPVGTTVTFGSQSTVGMGFDLLISLFHSVIAPYRNSSGCGWIMSDTAASLVRRIKTTDGIYAWQPAVTAGQPDSILSKPVFIDPNVAVPAANAKSIIFGDISQYFIRIAGGVRFERSDEFAFGTDLVSFRALLRGDGALIDLTGAVKVFAHSAT